MLDAGKHCNFPIGNMPGEDDHPPAGCDRAIHVLEAMRLNAPAYFKDAYFPQVRVFGRDAAEIVPHAGDDAPDLGLGARERRG